MTVAGSGHLLDRRPPGKGDHRRTAILAGLEDLLRERPFAKINIGDVASAAGLERSAFYFYFPNKATAVAALLGDVFDEIIASAGDFLTNEQRTAAAAKASILAGVRSVEEAWFRHRHLMLAMLDARHQDTAVRALWEQWLERLIAPMALAVHVQRDAGHAPPGPDAHLLIETLTGMNERALEQLSRSTDPGPRREAVIETLASIWTSAIYGGQNESD